MEVEDAMNYFHCTKNWIYTNLLSANLVQKVQTKVQ